MSGIDEQNRKIEPAQWSVVAIIVAFATGAFLYKLLMHERLGHSAAMFLGIPAVLAILLALAPKAKTATGGILKGITLALLVVAPLLGEDTCAFSSLRLSSISSASWSDSQWTGSAEGEMRSSAA